MAEKLAPPKEPIGIVAGSEKVVDPKTAPKPGEHEFTMDKGTMDSGGEVDLGGEVIVSTGRVGTVVGGKEELPPGEIPPAPVETPPVGKETEPPPPVDQQEKRISDLMRGYEKEHQARLKAEEDMQVVAGRLEALERRPTGPEKPVDQEGLQREWTEHFSQRPQDNFDRYHKEHVAPEIAALKEELQMLRVGTQFASGEEKYKATIEEIYTEKPELRQASEHPWVRGLVLQLAESREQTKGAIEAARKEIGDTTRRGDARLLKGASAVASPSVARIEGSDDFPANGTVEQEEEWFKKKNLIKD